MRTIQIAPNREDCRIIGNKVTGTFNGLRLVFEIPRKYKIYSYQHEHLIRDFCGAIALCSKRWQVEDVLNRHWQIKGGKFYSETL